MKPLLLTIHFPLALYTGVFISLVLSTVINVFLVFIFFIPNRKIISTLFLLPKNQQFCLNFADTPLLAVLWLTLHIVWDTRFSAVSYWDIANDKVSVRVARLLTVLMEWLRLILLCTSDLQGFGNLISGLCSGPRKYFAEA